MLHAASADTFRKKSNHISRTNLEYHGSTLLPQDETWRLLLKVQLSVRGLTVQKHWSQPPLREARAQCARQGGRWHRTCAWGELAHRWISMVWWRAGHAHLPWEADTFLLVKHERPRLDEMTSSSSEGFSHATWSLWLRRKKESCTYRKYPPFWIFLCGKPRSAAAIFKLASDTLPYFRGLLGLSSFIRQKHSNWGVPAYSIISISFHMTCPCRTPRCMLIDGRYLLRDQERATRRRRCHQSKQH